MLEVALVLGAYLAGSISSSILIVRLVAGYDIRQHGSRNAGASNVLRVVGFAPALAVLAIDVLKGVLPVQVATWVEAPGGVIGAAAVAAVVGHMFPAFHGLRGGKGVATATGALGSLAPLPAALSAAVFFAIASTTRYVALASLIAVTSFPLLLYLCGWAGWTAAVPRWLLGNAGVIVLLVIIKHHDNIRRLMSGREHRLGDAEPGEQAEVKAVEERAPGGENQA
ncbi:MAG: glycerol-3-phosphate 1-O-acyltransferase PlsY [Acidobacteriota bacterium]